jgi:hypothetical protein
MESENPSRDPRFPKSPFGSPASAEHRVDPAEAGPRYSPFWACIAVFSALLLANIYQSVSIFQTRGQIKQALKRAEEVLPEARLVQKQLGPPLQDLATELLQLSSTNAAARQMVEQFKITFNPAAAAAGAKSGTNGPAAR